MKRCISEAEAAFIEGGVTENVRSDGRGRLSMRPMDIETGLIPQANGSARLRLGTTIGSHTTTDVLVGVKAELVSPLKEAPDCGLLRFSVQVPPEVGSGGAASQDSVTAADELGMEIARTLARVIGGSCDELIHSLCVAPGRYCWLLHVDAVVIDRSGGNLFDAVGLAVRAALSTTTLPKISLSVDSSETQGIESDEIDLSEDPMECYTINAACVPVCVTVLKVNGPSGSTAFIDGTEEEEMCAGAKLTVGVTPKGMMCGLHKSGRGALPPSSLGEMIRVAQKVGLEMIKSLNLALKMERNENTPPIGFF